MKTKLILVALAAAACALFAFGYWRYNATRLARNVTHVVIVRDPSASAVDGCGSVAGLADRALTTPGLARVSTITLLAIGDEATANEPRLLGEFRVPEVRRVIEGKRAAVRQREELFAGLRARCEEARRTQVSPVFLGAKRGVERLRSVGSDADHKILYVQTDGEETADPQIKRALNGAPADSLKLPRPIQNDGVTVVICGLAETTGQVRGTEGKLRRLTMSRDPHRADRMTEVWKALFTNRELVSLEPYCQKPPDAGTSFVRTEAK
jgi:hypothetical protein